MTKPVRRLGELGLLLVFTILLGKACVDILAAIFRRVHEFPTELALALTIYLLSHLIRMLRLSVLIGGMRIPWLASLYFFTSACSMVTPFKLGELFRIHEIGRCTGNLWKGLWLVWIERIFDMCAIGLGLLLLLAMRIHMIDAVLPLILLILAFLSLTFAVFVILPEHLDNLNLYVIKTYQGNKAIRILLILEYFGNLCHMANELVRGKLSTLVILTLLVWAMELTAISIVAGSTEPLIDSIFLLLQRFVGLLSTDGLQQPEYPPRLGLYAILQSGVLLLVGTLSLLYYGRERIRQIFSPEYING